MKIALLLSGGVDSSVALARLKRTYNAEITAFYLKIWLEDELAFLGSCPWEEDLRFARAVASQLAVPLEVLSLQTAYHERVVAHVLAELADGRTPSPDLHCNERVKFGAFLDLVGSDFDLVATGHYASVLHPPDGAPSRLFAAADPVKDQTYFLSRLSPQQLSRSLFPLGDVTKPEVRAEAHALGLPTERRPDSQGICFLGKIPYPEFVRHHLGDRPGPIVHATSGRTLGTHRGLWFHTIGQRHGLGLGGGPWFVVDKVADTLLVAHASERHAFARVSFTARAPRWLAGPPSLPARVEVKLRHGPRRIPATLTAGPTSDTLQVTLDAPDSGIAPGQFSVFYQGDECLGSAAIT